MLTVTGKTACLKFIDTLNLQMKKVLYYVFYWLEKMCTILNSRVCSEVSHFVHLILT